MLQVFNPERMEYIFQNMDNAVCLTAYNGTLLFANPAAEKLFNLTVGGNTRIWDAIPYVEGNDALIQLFIDGVMHRQQSAGALVDYFNCEGVHFDLHVSLTCEPGKEGAVLIVIIDLSRVNKIRSALTRYTSPEIADFVLTSPEGDKRGGHAEDVTILMSDLRGFSAMSTRLSSDQMIELLNHYFESMSAVIERQRGTIIEFLGDGIFVVFGAPIPLQDHAAAAVRCAVDMENEMDAVNAWNQERGFPVLEMGIGINSGRVTVGNIGSEKKMKYGCIGEAVNIAGRLESFTIGGQVLISETTRGLISNELRVAGERTFLPKGSDHELKLYDVTGIGDCALHGSAARQEWVTLSEGIHLTYQTLDGKIVNSDKHSGHLKRISKDRRFGLLSSRKHLQVLQNLFLQIRGLEVYAKVLSSEEDGYLLSFTVRPEGWDDSTAFSCGKKASGT